MISALLILAQASAGPAEPAAAKTYGDCIRQQAVRLSPSAETAEVVATAALTLCNSLLTPAARALDQASNDELRKRGWTVGDLGSTTRMQERLEKEAEKVALTIIVEERLKSKTK